MATRYYLSLNAPGAVYHGPAVGVWHGGAFVASAYSPVQYTMQLWPSTTSAGLKANRTLLTNLAYWRAAPADVFIMRWVTPPLAAQTISGTLDLCAMVQGYWSTNVAPLNTHEAQAVYKVHAYIAQGQTTTPRHVLLDNYVDSTLFPSWDLVQTWRRLTSPAALTSGACQAGDVVVVEIGVRVLSSPDHTPHYNDPDDLAVVQFRLTGADPADADASAGDTVVARNPWLEFSATLTALAAPAPPANDAEADAIAVTALPYHSPVIDASTSTDTLNRVWWTVTIPDTALYCFHLFGSTGGARLVVTGPGMGGMTAREPDVHRNQGFFILSDLLQSGDVYTVRVESFVGVGADGALNGPVNGAVRFGCFKVSVAPQVDDLYLPSTNLYQFRDGLLVHVDNQFGSYVSTGVAFDYSSQPLKDINTDAMHTGHRLLIASHDFDEIDLIDPTTIETWLTGSLDYSFTAVSASVPTHPCQLAVTSDGTLYTGFFGDGYLTTCGVGTNPSFLSTVSDDSSASVIRRMSAATGENQLTAPSYEALPVSIEQTAPWAIAIDEDAGILYYTSSSVYIDVAGATDTISRWDIVNDVQLADLATLAVMPSSGGNAGLKGLAVIPGGGLLVCNGPVVQRLNEGGTVVQTYTPSVAIDAQALIDIALTADGDAFWTVDLWSTRLFKFDLASGAELMTTQPYATGGATAQIALYQPSGVSPPNGGGGGGGGTEPPDVAPSYHLDARYIRRLRRAPHLAQENQRVFYRRFELDLERGQGLATGQGSDPMVLLRLSRDGGQTWGEEQRMAAGKLGAYTQRVIARRLGQARDTVFEVVVSDPIAWSLVGAWLDLEPGTS